MGPNEASMDDSDKILGQDTAADCVSGSDRAIVRGSVRGAPVRYV
jgi:hypothetical protein